MKVHVRGKGQITIVAESEVDQFVLTSNKPKVTRFDATSYIVDPESDLERDDVSLGD